MVHTSPPIQEFIQSLCQSCQDIEYYFTGNSGSNPAPDSVLSEVMEIDEVVEPVYVFSPQKNPGPNDSDPYPMLYTEDENIDYNSIVVFLGNPPDFEWGSEMGTEPKLLEGYHFETESLHLFGQPYDFAASSSSYVSYEYGPVPEPIFITEPYRYYPFECLEPPVDDMMKMGSEFIDDQMLSVLNPAFKSYD